MIAATVNESHATSLFRSRIPAERAGDPDVAEAAARVEAVSGIDMARLAELGGMQQCSTWR